MMDFGINLAESTIYQPLIEALQSKLLHPAYISDECVDKSITQMFDTRENSNQLVMCTDFSKYDQHFNSQLQEIAKHVLIKLFSNDYNAAHVNGKTNRLDYQTTN